MKPPTRHLKVVKKEILTLQIIIETIETTCTIRVATILESIGLVAVAAFILGTFIRTVFIQIDFTHRFMLTILIFMARMDFILLDFILFL
jgi:hypothetical protein